MATAKRLYLYTVSGVALGLLLAATTIFTGLLLDRLGLGTGTVAAGPANDSSARESLALAISYVVVGLPLWLFHWALVERMVSGEGPGAAAERQSILRAVYFGIVLVSLIAVATASGSDLLREAICQPLGASNDPYIFYSPNLSGSAAWLIVALGAFVYHAWIRARDIRLGPTIKAEAAWWSRLFFYGFAFGAITAALIYGGSAITTGVEALSGYANPAYLPQTVSKPGVAPLVEPAIAAWWVRPLVSASVAALCYGLAWLGHWLYASRLAARTDEQGSDERTSRVRLTYFVLVVAVAVGYVLSAFGAALGVALRYAVGSWHAAFGQSALGEALGPLLAVLPLIAAWAWHRRRAAWEWYWQSGSPLRAVRPMDYLTSLIGLAAFGGALVSFLEILAQKFVGTDNGVISSLDKWRSSAMTTAGVMVVAGVIWLWPWLAGQGRRALDVAGEARSTSRRTFLLAVSAVTLLAGASSLAFIVYRVTRVGVGLESTSLGSDVRMPLCVLVVAGSLLAYHAFWIRRDLSVPTAAEWLAPVAAHAPVASAAAPGAVPVPPGAPASPALELVIVGPTGADLEALRASLAEKLPDGYSMIVRSRGDAARP
jgi:hypothetical protein